MAEATASTQVLVVGGGPVGLMLACLLREQGVSCIVVDRGEGIDPRPRAITLHSTAIDLFAGLGLLDELRSLSIAMDRISFHARDGREFVGRMDGWGGTVDGYLNTLQPSYQALLRDEAERRGAVVRFGSGVVGLTESSASVLATLVSSRGRSTVEADFVVAADGAASTVRRLLSIPMEGESPTRSYLLLEGDPVLAPPPGETGLYVGDSGMVTLSPLPEGKVRVAGPADEKLRLDRDHEISPGDAARLIDELGFGDRLRLSAVDRATHYTVRQQVASSFHRGRILLAGDAAHLNAPAGGQGVNLGFGDAEALAWRIAVALDTFDTELLSSYSAERRRDAIDTIEQADVFPIVRAIRGKSAEADDDARALLVRRADAWSRFPPSAAADPRHPWRGARVAFNAIAGAATREARFTVLVDRRRLRLSGGPDTLDRLPLPRGGRLSRVRQIAVDDWPFPERGGRRPWPADAPRGFLVSPDRVVRAVMTDNMP